MFSYGCRYFVHSMVFRRLLTSFTPFPSLFRRLSTRILPIFFLSTQSVSSYQVSKNSFIYSFFLNRQYFSHLYSWEAVSKNPISYKKQKTSSGKLLHVSDLGKHFAIFHSQRFCYMPLNLVECLSRIMLVFQSNFFCHSI